MERLLEHEIFASVLGETIIQDHLDKISIHNGMGSGSYSDCEEYIINPVNFCEDSYFSALFKITDSIKKRWKEKRLDIRVYLYLKDLKIVGGHIFKYRNTDISCRVISTSCLAGMHSSLVMRQNLLPLLQSASTSSDS